MCVYACAPVFLTINEHVAAFGSGYVLDSYVSDSAGACLCAELCVLVFVFYIVCVRTHVYALLVCST